MKILITAFLLFFSSFFINIMVWRIKKPEKEIYAIFLIFNFVLFSFLLLNQLVYNVVSLSLWNNVHFILLYLGLTFSYMTTYGAIPLGSPTFIILLEIRRSGERGLAFEDFYSLVTEDMFINLRIKELIQAKHITDNNSLYHITPSGIKFLTIFYNIKGILNKVDSGG